MKSIASLSMAMAEVEGSGRSEVEEKKKRMITYSIVSLTVTCSIPVIIRRDGGQHDDGDKDATW